jgi:hypothetical protein
MGALRDRYIAIGLGVVIAAVATSTAAYAFIHSENGVLHGLDDGSAVGLTHPGTFNFSTVEVRHYFPDGSFNVQCADFNNGNTSCQGDFGSLPCQKRYVGGTDGLLARHFVRRSGCPGDLHGP